MIAGTSREVYNEVVKPTAEAVRKKIKEIVRQKERVIQEEVSIILGKPLNNISGRFTEMVNETKELKIDGFSRNSSNRRVNVYVLNDLK